MDGPVFLVAVRYRYEESLLLLFLRMDKVVEQVEKDDGFEDDEMIWGLHGDDGFDLGFSLLYFTTSRLHGRTGRDAYESGYSASWSALLIACSAR